MTRQQRDRAASGAKCDYDGARIKRVRAEGKCSQCRKRPARPSRRECALCASRRSERDHLRGYFGIPLPLIRELGLTPHQKGRTNADR